MHTRKLHALAALAMLLFAGSARAGTLQFLADGYLLPSQIDGNNIIGGNWFYDGSTYTTLAYPGATKTTPYGVYGGIVSGYYVDATKTTHAFLYNGTTYSNIDDPLGVKSSAAGGISGNKVVGVYVDASGKPHGFLYNGTTWSTIDDPLGVKGNSPQYISGNNIAGSYEDANSVWHAYLYDGLTYRTIDDPLGINGSTTINGISGDNVVGYYKDANSVLHGFLYNAASNTWTTVDPAAGFTTIAWGVSGSNVVGASSYQGAGFIYNPTTGFSSPLVASDFAMFYPYNPMLEDISFGFTGISGNKIIGTVTNSFLHLTFQRGFIYTIPEPSSLLLASFGTAGAFLLARRCRGRGRDSPR